MLFGFGRSKEELECEQKSELARLKRRAALNLPGEAPKLVVQGIPVRKFEIDFDFWDGFHINESLAIVKIFLRDKDDCDHIVSLSRYMKYAKIGFMKMAQLVSDALLTLTFFHYSENVSAVHLKLADVTARELKQFLAQANRGSLRGMEERSIIVCESGNGFIMAHDVVGYIPSMPTSHVTYPNAIYRDGDLCDILVDAGEPVVEYGNTSGVVGFPVKFNVLKGTPKNYSRLLWAVQFEIVDGEV